MNSSSSTSSTSLLAFHNWSLHKSLASSTHLTNNNNTNTKQDLPNIYFHSIKFSANSLYVWIGDNELKLDNVSCAMPTPFSATPLATDIMLARENNDGDVDSLSLSSDLGAKLSKKLNKQVILSFNVNKNLLKSTVDKQTNNDYDSFMINLITKCLFDEIK